MTKRLSMFRRYASPPDPKGLRPFGPLNYNVSFTSACIEQSATLVSLYENGTSNYSKTKSDGVAL